MRGSSSDQPRSSDDPAYGQPEISPKVTRVSSSGGSGSERVPPPASNLGLGTSGGGSGDRPPSYQTEERYWTDYLRIALPIAGLLLLLSVFWFWASSFIGDDDNATQTPVVAINVTPQDAVTLTPTLADVTVLDTPTTGAVTEPTQAPATEPTQAPAVEPTQAPAVEPTTATEPTQAATGEFAVDDLVIVNDNDVNMRSDATTAADVVDTLSQGTELRILSSTPQTSTADDGTTLTWWNVSDDALGVQGWVAGQFLEK